MALKRVADRVSAREPEKINVSLVELSLELDVDADSEWFCQHPGQDIRERRPTALEIAACQVPPDSVVEVIQVAPGVHYRKMGNPRRRRPGTERK